MSTQAKAIEAAITPTAWYNLPEARRLLGSCAVRRPAVKWHTQQYALTRDEWWTFEGTRADRLREIASEHLSAALKHSDTMTDRKAASAYMEAAGSWVSVEQAIEDATAFLESVGRAA